MKINSKYFINEIAITFNIAEADDGRIFDPHVAKLCEQARNDVNDQKKGIEKELLEYIEKYPKEPAFRNYLTVHYQINNKYELAMEVNAQILQEFPNYIYARLVLVQDRIKNGMLDNMEELLGANFDINSAWPNRNVFHIGEVFSYFNVLIQFLITSKNFTHAENRLEYLENMENEFPKIPYSNSPYLSDNLKFALIREGIAPEGFPLPVLKNKILYELYCNSLRIDHGIIKKILQLPKDTLIADIETILRNLIEHHDEWKQLPSDPRCNQQLMHALAITSELKDPDLLPVVLELLAQDKSFLYVWLSDYLTEDMYKVLYAIGKYKPDVLLKFALREDVDTYSRTAISQALSLLAAMEPNRRIEVIEWYRQFLNVMINKAIDAPEEASSVVEFYISDLTNIHATELEELIIDAFHLYHDPSNYVFEDIDEMLEGLRDSYIYDDHHKPYVDIFQFYEKSLKKWHDYKVGNDLLDIEKIRSGMIDLEYNDELPFDSDVLEFDDDDDYTPTIPIIKPPEPGRNDPCFCGSGKKYKKCCMVN